MHPFIPGFILPSSWVFSRPPPPMRGTSPMTFTCQNHHHHRLPSQWIGQSEERRKKTKTSTNMRHRQRSSTLHHPMPSPQFRLRAPMSTCSRTAVNSAPSPITDSSRCVRNTENTRPPKEKKKKNNRPRCLGLTTSKPHALPKSKHPRLYRQTVPVHPDSGSSGEPSPDLRCSNR